MAKATHHFRNIRLGVPCELPTSTPEAPRIVNIRSVGADFLIRLGRVPDTLTSVLAAHLSNRQPRLETKEDLEAWVQFIDLYVKEAVVVDGRPAIKDEPDYDAGELHLDDLTLEDKLFIFTVANAPVREMERFRYQPRRDVESVPIESKPAYTTEQAAEPETMDS